MIFTIASIDAAAAAAIAATATVIAAALTALSASRLAVRKERKEAEDQATQVLRQIRDPLLRAVFDLQSRLYNVVAKDFFGRYWRGADDEARQYARNSTLWLFGQFLGWSEILRREVQFLDLGSRVANREMQRRLNDVASALASDAYGRDNTFILFRSDQRAVGEFMVTERETQSGKRPDCFGYSEFVRALAELEGLADDSRPEAVGSPVVSWARRFTAEIDVAAVGADGNAQARLVRVQRRLINLLDLLDPDRLRYPNPDLRGKLPWTEADRKPRPKQVAKFVWPWTSPWSGADAWAEGRRLQCSSTPAGERSYHGKRGLLGGRPEFRLVYEHGSFTICAWTAGGKGPRRVDGSLRSRRARLALDDLLDRYDRPLVNEASRPFRAVSWIRRRL